jgi:peroxin-7
MLEYRTQGYNGYSVKYSPFFDSRIAVAASANFGLVGNGRVFILGLTPQGIVAEKWYASRLLFVQLLRSYPPLPLHRLS